VLQRLKSTSPANVAVTPPSKSRRRSTRSKTISRWIAGSLVVALASGGFALVQKRQPAKDSGSGPVIPPPGIDVPTPEPPRITAPDELPSARAGDSYSHDLTATDGVPPYSWSLDGLLLPDGLGLDESGRISGIPTAAGTSGFVVRVTDANKQTAGKSLQLAILEKPPAPPPVPEPEEKPDTTAPPPPSPKPLPEPLVPMIAADKENPHVNSLGMKFVPAGTPDVLFSVWLTRVQDFRAFVEATRHDAKKGVFSVEIGGRFGFFPQGDYWEKPGFAQSEEHPVCGVSWDDAKAFCKWLTDKERREGAFGPAFEYRLPTDAEWIAALAIKSPGKAPRYPWGIKWPPPEGRGNLAGQELRDGGVTPIDWPKLSIRDDIPRTSRVDRFPANPFGIHDSFGNLWQFCEDATDSGKTRRLLRGGSWGSSDSDELKLEGPPPKDRTADGRATDAGFRCVLARTR
jgi:hypothetical protein